MILLADASAFVVIFAPAAAQALVKTEAKAKSEEDMGFVSLTGHQKATNSANLCLWNKEIKAYFSLKLKKKNVHGNKSTIK